VSRKLVLRNFTAAHYTSILGNGEKSTKIVYSSPQQAATRINVNEPGIAFCFSQGVEIIISSYF